MLDVLIHTTDTFYLDPVKVRYDADLDRLSNMKRGYVQTVKRTGYKWGKLELDRKRFIIARIEDHWWNPAWLELDYDVDGNEVCDRRVRFPLRRLLSIGEYDALKNVTYNEQTIREPIIKRVDLRTIEQVNNWEDHQREPLRLHGSAGDFSIQEDGGGDYTSLKTAVETEASDISGGAVDANFYITETWTSADTGNWDLDGWTMGSNNMLVQTQGDSRSADGNYRSDGFRIENTTQTFDIETLNCTIDGIQFKNTAVGILVSGNGDSGTIKNCIGHSQSGDGHAISNGGTPFDIYNNILFKGYEAATTSVGINLNAGSTLFNNTISGYNVGIARVGGTVTSTNCAVFNNDDDFSGSSHTVTNCASDDGDGSNPQTLDSSNDYENEFTDYLNGDFSLVSGSVCIDNGTNTGAPSDDIIGTARPQNSITDIGAFEFLSGGGVTQDVSGILPEMSGSLAMKKAYHRAVEGSI